MERPFGVGAFQFVVLASLRAVQLTRGCRPRIDGVHKHTVMAQLEVSQGKVMRDLAPFPDAAGRPAIRDTVAPDPLTPALVVV